MSRSIFFFQAEDGIPDADVTGVQTCALPNPAPASGEPGAGQRAAALQPRRQQRSEERRVGKECGCVCKEYHVKHGPVEVIGLVAEWRVRLRARRCGGAWQYVDAVVYGALVCF